MKKRFFSILLSLCMVLMLCPVTAFAEEEPLVIFEYDHGTLNGQDDHFVFGVNDLQKMPSLDGCDPYKFLGWKIQGSGSSAVIPAGEEIYTGSINADTTFVAVYKQVTIQYEFDKGKLPADREKSETILYGDGVVLPDLGDCGSYKFLGWQILRSDDLEVYPAGTEYYPSKDMTFVAVYDEITTFSFPFTTTVKQGGNVAPGKTTFHLQAVGPEGDKLSSGDVEVTASITTNGAGNYKGSMTFTGPSKEVLALFDDGGVFVRQVNEGEPNWTYSDTVWCLRSSIIAMASSDDAAPGSTICIYPTGFEESGDGGRYYYPDSNANPVSQMTFINTYTKSITEPTEPTESSESTSSVKAVKNSKTTKSPKTGDNSNLALWFALFAVSAAGVAGTGVCSKRRRSSRTK